MSDFHSLLAHLQMLFKNDSQGEKIMRKIKAVIIEFDNGTRVGYENWPESENVPPTQFRVGDLVRLCRSVKGIPSALMQDIGVIRVIRGQLMGVEWAEFRDGHDLGGLAHRPGSGFNFYDTDIEHA